MNYVIDDVFILYAMKNIHEKFFLREYGMLNHEQRRAVDAIEGPVMVSAGPGTGKTSVLILRIEK